MSTSYPTRGAPQISHFRGDRVFFERTGGERFLGTKIFIGGFSMMLPLGSTSISPCWLGIGDVLFGSGEGQTSITPNVPVESTKLATSASATGLAGET